MLCIGCTYVGEGVRGKANLKIGVENFGISRMWRVLRSEIELEDALRTQKRFDLPCSIEKAILPLICQLSEDDQKISFFAEHAVKNFFAFRMQRLGLLGFCRIDLGIKVQNNQLTVLRMVQVNKLLQVVNGFVSFALICGTWILSNDAQSFRSSCTCKRNLEVGTVSPVVEKTRLYIGKINVFKVRYRASTAHDA